MKTRPHIPHRSLWAGLVRTCATFCVAAASAIGSYGSDYFLRIIDGQPLNGTSTDRDYPADQGWFRVANFSLGIEMPTTASRSDGGGATVGRANFINIEFDKDVNSASPQIFMAAAKGTNLEKVQLVVRQTISGGRRLTNLMFELGHVLVTSQVWAAGGEENPKEAVKLNYGEMRISYRTIDPETGKLEGAVIRGQWSTIKNKEEFTAPGSSRDPELDGSR